MGFSPTYRKHRFTVVTLAALAVLLFTLGCFFSYQNLRNERRNEARADAQRMLLAFEAHSTRLFDYADGYLRALRAFRAANQTGENWELFVKEIRAPHAEAFSGVVNIVDRDGWVVYHSEIPSDRLKAFGKMSDLDHYRYFVDHPGDSLFVGATRLGRITGKQQFRLARPLFRDGAFDGLVELTLLPDYMTDFYRNTSLGPHSTVTMLTLEPKLIARQPPPPAENYDQTIPNLKERFGIDTQSDAVGSVFDDTSPFDNFHRDIFFKKLPGYPVVIVIGIAEQDLDDAIADTRRNLILLASFFIAIASGVTTLVLRMIDQNQRLTRSEAASRLSERQSQISEARLNSIFDASPDALLISDPQGTITMANKQVEGLFGYTVGDLLGRSMDILVPEGFHNIHRERQGQARRKNGAVFDVEISMSQFETDQGSFVACSLRDVTERKRVEEELRVAATAFDVQEGIVITDANEIILRVNNAFIDSSGYSAEELVGQTPRLLRSGRHDAAFYAEMWQSLKDHGLWQGEVWDRRKNGEIYPKWLSIKVVNSADGEVSHYVASHTDISERKAAEDEIKSLAFYDPLTHLPNRRLLMDRLRQALSSSIRSGHEGALMLVDLDHFKTLNDSLGHEIGDLLLQQVALRLQDCVRDTDTVARLGGDEFVVLLEDLSKAPKDAAIQAQMVGEKILSTLAQAYLLAGREQRSTPSIGITLFSDQGRNISGLMKQADLAMYHAKAEGRNRLHFFDPDLQIAAHARISLEEDLRQGIKNGQFFLLYQPQVEYDRIIGAEALIRWQHPQRGMVPPVDFIPLAEETGVILPLGLWVLETACTQIGAWAKSRETADLTIAVNVSAQQLSQNDFVEQVLSVLDRTNANPERLKLELTESMLAENVEETIAKMNALKSYGVKFSLDDFGTGYSSLAYLKRLPLGQLKIDRSFVMDVLTDPNDAAIARTIIALGQTLGMMVIAEGIETVDQRDFLASSGCHAYQGYLFSRPVTAAAFEDLLKKPALTIS